MNYTHLTQEERYQIYALKEAGQKQSQIASVLGGSESMICRELKRNGGRRGYRPQQVPSKAVKRRAINACQIDEQTWLFVQERPLEQCSPEQISGLPI